jgi:cytochrome c oxidase subunit 2
VLVLWEVLRGISLAPQPVVSFARAIAAPLSPTNIFAPASEPAQSVFDLSMLMLAITGAIFVIVGGLLVYAAVKFRRRKGDDGREPAQVYGSTQVELAWTITPVIIVLVLFLATMRAIFNIQEIPQPKGAMEVTIVGHQFWWELRYPGLNVVTANELHLPVGEKTFLTLLSADTDHSFWVPRLSGKTDLVPNHPNKMWIEPHQAGVYLGQCAQYCGTQHAMMLLRVYVEPREDFDRWVAQQGAAAHAVASAAEGRRIFERTACINCHTVAGTAANGRFGPDLTHLMSRETLASGAAENTPGNLRRWIERPDAIKPGSLMPPMGLTGHELDAVTAYMASLR